MSISSTGHGGRLFLGLLQESAFEVDTRVASFVLDAKMTPVKEQVNEDNLHDLLALDVWAGSPGMLPPEYMSVESSGGIRAMALRVAGFLVV